MSTDIHALSGAYAVDALDEDERVEFEQHLAACPTCQAEVDGLREAAATLAETNAVEPPAGLRERVLGDIRTVRPLPPVVGPRTDETDSTGPTGPSSPIGSPPPAGPTSDRPRHRWRDRRRGWMALAAAAAAVVALGGGIWHPWTHSSAPSEMSAVARVEHAPDVQRFTAPGPDGATVTVYRSRSLNRAAVVAQGLGNAPAGKVYQLWLQDSSGVMRPAGFLAPGSRTSAPLSGTVAADAAEAAGISIEPAGGSPAPTTKPVAVLPMA